MSRQLYGYFDAVLQNEYDVLARLGYVERQLGWSPDWIVEHPWQCLSKEWNRRSLDSILKAPCSVADRIDAFPRKTALTTYIYGREAEAPNSSRLYKWLNINDLRHGHNTTPER